MPSGRAARTLDDHDVHRGAAALRHTGALRLSGMTAPMVLDGPMNGDAFEAYVEQVLVPTLRPGEIVIMDNLPAHRRPTIRAATEAAGAVLRHRDALPAFTPGECANYFKAAGYEPE